LEVGYMMNVEMWSGGWMMGHGGLWTPVLVVVALIGLVAWIVIRKRK
jgi:hypothetical protein